MPPALIVLHAVASCCVWAILVGSFRSKRDCSCGSLAHGTIAAMQGCAQKLALRDVTLGGGWAAQIEPILIMLQLAAGVGEGPPPAPGVGGGGGGGARQWLMSDNGVASIICTYDGIDVWQLATNGAKAR